MRLESARPIYAFDTSALIAFALAQSRGHVALLTRLDATGQYFYHPVTLAELTEHFHEPLIAERQPQLGPRHRSAYVRGRRLLFTALCAHRKRDNPSEYLHGRRFLPFSTPFEWFTHLANQRSRPAHLRRMNSGSPTVLAPMTDHQILAAASWLHRCRFSVTFVSGDQEQLAAAAYLSIPWVYCHDPARTAAFP